METEEFKRIIGRMESGLRQEMTDLQFEEYLNSFGDEDASIFERGIQRVIDTQQWIPVVYQLKVFIQQIKDEDQGKASRERAEKDRVGDVKKKPADDGGWLLFGRFMLEKGIKWPKRDAQYEKEVEKLKSKFEKEHPGWQPRKKSKPRRSAQDRRGGMTRIGDVMKDAMGNLARSERSESK